MSRNPFRNGRRWCAIVSAAFLCAAPAASNAQSVNVLGSANPNLAGRASGYTCCSGDAVPGQAPPFLWVTGTSILTFQVRGFSDYIGARTSGNNPDGNENGSLTTFGDGISAPTNVRYNALYGVFLGSGDPTGGITPPSLDFSAGLNFTTLSPGLGQIFFIGDGLTSDSNLGLFNGSAQTFVAPTGAARIYFGSGDGFGWYNNSGSFDVTMTATSTVPEPTSVALMAAGLAALALAARRRRAA